MVNNKWFVSVWSVDKENFMNQNYEIYQAQKKDIPLEDKVRFEGYLYAKNKAIEDLDTEISKFKEMNNGK